MVRIKQGKASTLSTWQKIRIQKGVLVYTEHYLLEEADMENYILVFTTAYIE